MVTLHGTDPDTLHPVASTPNTATDEELTALADASRPLARFLGGKVTITASAASAVEDPPDTLTVTVYRRA